MKWRKGTFRIETLLADSDVVGLVSSDGSWGIDRPAPGSCRGGPWVLTHRPSGCKIGIFRTVAVAKECAAKFTEFPGTDWSLARPPVPRGLLGIVLDLQSRSIRGAGRPA